MKKRLSFTLSFIFFAFFVFSTAVLAQKSAFSFTDVDENAWYYDEVIAVYEAGIMEGKTSTTFDPTANMSRAEFVTVLCRLSDESYEGKGNNLSFSDTAKEAWYADYVAWGVETEMVKGLPDNKFAPNRAVSRQELAVFIDRFISYINTSLSDNSKIDTFADADKVADYAKEAVETMRKSGIITGDENGYFNPKSSASRAEVATVVTRILTLIEETKVAINSPFKYTAYIPDNYDKNTSYPLVIYFSVRNQNSTSILFDNINSPVHDSIVVVPTISPNDWGKITSEEVDVFTKHVKNNYNIDENRQYIIAVDIGGRIAWQYLLEHHTDCTAALFVQATSLRFWNTSEGYVAFEEDINPQMVELPIHIVHDITTMDDFEPEYGKWVYEALVKAGFENVELTETNGYGDNIVNNFVSKDDTSLLEWLFDQYR